MIVGGVRYIYGFAALCTQPYAVYVSDLDKVWIARPETAEVFDTARSVGIADFGHDKLPFFVAELAKLFTADPLPLHFSKVSDVEFRISAKVAGNIDWEFRLPLADSSVTAEFFRQVLLCEFANHSFLAYKVSQLENLLRARDEYTLYLEENYKTVNGSELMDKYKRQHADAPRLLATYDRDVSNQRISHLYRELVRNHHAEGDSLVWDNVDVALRDKVTWQANDVESECAVKLEQKSPIPLEDVKPDPAPSMGVVPKLESPEKRARSDSSSPKRKRLGIVGRR